MNDIVRYQLRKPAAAKSESFWIVAVPVDTELKKLVDGLHKVYKEKSPSIDVDLHPQARFRGDTGDFLELAGNLLDNACKWAGNNVTILLERLPDQLSPLIRICIEDDGPGLTEAERKRVMKRGVRLDERKPGSGLGLDIVQELAGIYGGRVELSESVTGGLRAVLLLPAAKNPQ